MAEIDLVRTELAALVDAVITAEDRGADPHEADPDAVLAPFGLYIFEGGDPAAELGRAVERSVFFEAFGDTPALLREEYEPYEASSRFFCLIDHRRRVPAGVVRVILPSQAGLKSLNDIQRVWGEPWEVVADRSGASFPADRTWDIATLAVTPDYRGRAASGLVALALYQAMFTHARLEALANCVTVLDVVVLRQVQYQFKKPFTPFNGIEPRRYLGSPLSAPVWSDVATWRRRLLVDRVEMHEMLFRGAGLEDAVRLPASMRSRLADMPVAAL